MLSGGAAALAWRWLLPAVPFVALAARLARGASVIRAFEQQRAARLRTRSSPSLPLGTASPSCLCVSDALHKPLAALSAAAIALRLAFLALALGDGRLDASALLFWLAQAPSVAYVALSAYMALLLLAIVSLGHWPGGGSMVKRSSPVIAAATVACLLFCALLAAAITLLAATRGASLSPSRRPHRLRRGDMVDGLVTEWGDGATTEGLRGLARAALLYLAFVWSVLGLLLLRAQANATRVLLGYDCLSTETRAYAPSRDPSKTIIPPVFAMKLSRGSVLLALMLLLRGGFSATVALLCEPESLARWFFLAQDKSWAAFWSVFVLDLSWELLLLLTVVSLLKTMPLAIYSWPVSDRRDRTATTESVAETDVTDPTDESDETEEADETAALLPSRSPSLLAETPVVGFRFQLPTLHALVQDYVVVTRQSLTRRMTGPNDVIYTYAHGEPERCVHHEPRASTPRADLAVEQTAPVAGSEFMECRCPPRRRREPDGLLPEAQVPLLSDEELADESFEVIDTPSDSPGEDSPVLSGSS